MTSKASSAAFHEDYARYEPVRIGSNRSFGLVFAVVFGLLGAVGLWRGFRATPWFLGLAGLFLLLALAFPKALAPLNRAWMAFGELLHRIVSPVILGLLYAVAIVPVGLLMRLFGKDPLRLRRDPQSTSYWIVRDPAGPPPETMSRQF
jgi:hypothetical protein